LHVKFEIIIVGEAQLLGEKKKSLRLQFAELTNCMLEFLLQNK